MSYEEITGLNALPREVLLLPMELQQQYLVVFNEVSQRQSLSVAQLVAWEVVKDALRNKKEDAPDAEEVIEDMKETVAPEQEDKEDDDSKELVTSEVTASQPMKSSVVAVKEDDRIIVHIELMPANKGEVSKEFVAHADGDDIVFEGVLTDTMPNKQGKRFSAAALERFAEQINEYGIMGDISNDSVHEEWNTLITKYGDLPPKEFMKKARSERKGIVKVVKAVFDGARLWVKGVIDKRYKRFVGGVNKMSIEARIPKEYQQGDVYEYGDVLGLTLVDDRAVNPRSFIRPAV